MISSSQRTLPHHTQHSQQTNVHAPGGIRTHNPTRRAAADLRLRLRGHWDWLLYVCVCVCVCVCVWRYITIERFVPPSKCTDRVLTSFYKATNHFGVVRIPPSGNAGLIRYVVIEIRHELRWYIMVTLPS